MRHVMLTCRNHTYLRWTCKSIAYTPGHGYNQLRNIFFTGDAGGNATRECYCPPSDLIIAPEDPWASLTLEEQREEIRND